MGDSSSANSESSYHSWIYVWDLNLLTVLNCLASHMDAHMNLYSCVGAHTRIIACIRLIQTLIYSGTSLIRTLWDFFSPYYRGFLNSEVLDTLQYCTGTQIGVLNIEVPVS